jgi:chemotaxis protein methyltransferase CheR
MVTVALSDADYERFRSLILTRTGLDFPPVRRGDLESGLRRSLAQVQDAFRYHREAAASLPALSGLDDLYQALVADLPAVWDIVVDALTVCETHFFRHAQQFEGLRDHVLQPLIAERRRRGDLSLRLWSAGCASGEEAYSLAILLQEMLSDWANWRLDILGTDLNQHSLDRAQQAVYRDWSFREAFAQQRRQQYFHQQDAQFILRENVRGMVRFRICNLVEDCTPLFPDGRKLDVIFCRNVILYFGANVRRWVYQRLYEALAPGGYLIGGPAAPPPPNFTPRAARRVSSVKRRPSVRIVISPQVSVR